MNLLHHIEKEFGLKIFHEVFGSGSVQAVGHDRHGLCGSVQLKDGRLVLDNEEVKGEAMMQRALDTVADAAQRFLKIAR